jgi:hypothetical protein
MWRLEIKEGESIIVIADKFFIKEGRGEGIKERGERR